MYLQDNEKSRDEKLKARIFMNLTEMGFSQDIVAEALNLGMKTEEAAIEYINESTKDSQRIHIPGQLNVSIQEIEKEKDLKLSKILIGLGYSKNLVNEVMALG